MQYGQILSYQLSNNILRPKNNRLICTPLLKFFFNIFVYRCECFSSPEEYYKESIFVSSTNSVILNLDTPFKRNNMFLLKWCYFNENILKPMNLNMFYEDRMYGNAFRSEYLSRCEKWINVEKHTVVLNIWWMRVV